MGNRAPTSISQSPAHTAVLFSGKILKMALADALLFAAPEYRPRIDGSPPPDTSLSLRAAQGL